MLDFCHPSTLETLGLREHLPKKRMCSFGHSLLWENITFLDPGFWVRLVRHSLPYMVEKRPNKFGLETHAGKQKPKEWIQLAKEGNFEKLTKELIVEYYDKNYKKPRGDPLATYEVIFH